jgi:MazG family protein
MSDASPPTPRLPAPAAAAPTADAEFRRLVDIMRILRSPDGCPWDRQQTWKTLAPYALEEASEVLDAIERADAAGLCGEIGDLVFEGVFLAQVAADDGCFTIADALRSVSDKLIRRHPHVFVPDPAAGTEGHGVDTPQAVVEQWEQIKVREREAAGDARASALDGVPLALPALARARALGAGAATVGFDWPDPRAVLDKVREEIAELEAEHQQGRQDAVAEELGDLFFALAQFARKAGIDPEAALRAANRKFAARFQALEREVAATRGDLSALSLDELERVWQRVKNAPG